MHMFCGLFSGKARMLSSENQMFSVDMGSYCLQIEKYTNLFWAAMCPLCFTEKCFLELSTLYVCENQKLWLSLKPKKKKKSPKIYPPKLTKIHKAPILHSLKVMSHFSSHSFDFFILR